MDMRQNIQLTDIDGNTLRFTYSGDKLNEVRDAFGRKLTLTYSGDKLMSVADSAGRSVSYEYTGGNLIRYTDPDGKVWNYAYTDANNPHMMTSMTNPLSIVTVTNFYDSLGRVETQTTPRQTGSATYNFYFSGFRNVEQDPDGYNIVYHYDEKGRPIETEDQLGNKSYEYYDGQFHVITSIDPRNNYTDYYYDGDQNLIRTINALTLSTDYVYDSQFRLTDTVDPYYHGIHIDYDSEHHPVLSKYRVTYNTNFYPVDSGIYQTRATYYGNGLAWNKTDGLGTVTTLTYAMQTDDGLISGRNPEIQNNYLWTQRIDNFYGIKMLKVFAICCVNYMDSVIQHCSSQKIIKDGLRFGTMLCYKSGNGVNSSGSRSNNLNAAMLFIKFNKFFCLQRRQRMLDPSFISNDGIELNKVLDGNDCFYFSNDSLFNNGFTNNMEFRILVVGIDKDIRINQIYGQDIPRKACPGQGLACLYDRDERLEFSSEEFSSLLFVMVLFSFSDTRQSQLALQLFQEEGFLKCSLSFSVSQLASALFNPLLMIYLKLTKILSLVNAQAVGCEAVWGIFLCCCVSGVTPETVPMIGCRRMEGRMEDLSMQMDNGLIPMGGFRFVI